VNTRIASNRSNGFVRDSRIVMSENGGLFGGWKG
jgi:hypothetical protein